MKIHTRQDDEQFIAVEELSHLTGLYPMTIFKKANNGKIPGAVWGETLRFEKKEIDAWLMCKSEIEEILNELEGEGFLKSYLDDDGERRYFVPRDVRRRLMGALSASARGRGD